MDLLVDDIILIPALVSRSVLYNNPTKGSHFVGKGFGDWNGRVSYHR